MQYVYAHACVDIRGIVLFLVEWSCYETFAPAAGELIIDDPLQQRCVISNLAQGNMYFVRVSSWNVRGWSESAISSPPGVVPTCECRLPLKLVNHVMNFRRCNYVLDYFQVGEKWTT